MSLQGVSVGRLVRLSADRTPVLVDGQMAVLVGVPRSWCDGSKGQRVRVEYPNGRRRTVSQSDVEVPVADSGCSVVDPANHNGVVCGDNQVGPAQRQLPGPRPHTTRRSATWAS